MRSLLMSAAVILVAGVANAADPPAYAGKKPVDPPAFSGCVCLDGCKCKAGSCPLNCPVAPSTVSTVPTSTAPTIVYQQVDYVNRRGQVLYSVLEPVTIYPTSTAATYSTCSGRSCSSGSSCSGGSCSSRWR